MRNTAEKGLIEGLGSLSLTLAGRELYPHCVGTLNWAQRGSAAPCRVGGGCWGAQQEPRRVCSSKALLWHNAGARTVLQRRGQLRACLFMGVEALVAAVRLRELSLASACSDAVCGFIGVRHSHNTLLHTVGWYLPATFQP